MFRPLLFQAKIMKFVAAFGAVCGTKYVADGLTFEQAQARHNDHLVAQDAAKPAPPPQLANAVGTNLAHFASKLRLPGRKA